jgi:hypothetical protein
MTSNRRIPPEFPAANPSAAERRIYDLFGRDEGCRDMALIHSLFLSRHIKRSFGEIDFVILAPDRGVFLIEVKGGGMRRENGVWYTMDRSGTESRLAKGPMEQLKDTKFSLEKWLEDQLDSDRIRHRLRPQEIDALKQLRFGYGLMLTGNEEIPIEDPSWEEWMIFLRGDLSATRPISGFVERLSAGFREKPIWRALGAIPDRNTCALLERVLIGDFEVRYELISRLQDDAHAIEELTREQLGVLANTRFNSRCFFQGGAGTGKTVLAVELFLEKVELGERAALFCFNSLLADHLRERVRTLKPGIDLDHNHIGTLDAFMLGHVGHTIPEDPEARSRAFEDLPYAFLDKPADADFEPFDHVIVDEAQDLLTEERLMVLDAILANGLAQGGWTFFGDLSRQSIYRDRDTIERAKEQLRRMSGFYMAPPLTVNCRNTRRISQYVSRMTGAVPTGSRPGTPDGEAVDFHFPATANQRIAKLMEVLEELDRERVTPERVAILAPRKNAFDDLRQREEIAALQRRGLLLSTVQAFKGLESDVVILTGFRSLLDEADQKLLYIGMSRARVKLCLILDRELESQRTQLLERHMA